MKKNLFQKKVEKILEYAKLGKKIHVPTKLHGLLPNGKEIEIVVITKDMLEKDETIKLLAAWRAKSNIWFPAQFRVTFNSTKKWAKEQLLNKKDRILFFFQLAGSNKPFGHAGLYRFNYKEKWCEGDNMIRGIESEETRGGMTVGFKLLYDWTFRYLKFDKMYLWLNYDNTQAKAVHYRNGFKNEYLIPLVKKVSRGRVSWVEQDPSENIVANKFFLRMYLKNPYNDLKVKKS